MNRYCSIIFLLFITVLLGKSQNSFKAELETDLVHVDSLKMYIDVVGFSHYTTPVPPEPVQVRFRSEAPAKGLLSRDKFVQVSYEALRRALPQGNYFEPIDHASEFSPMIIVVKMRTEGVEISIVDQVEESNNTIVASWEDILKGRW